MPPVNQTAALNSAIPGFSGLTGNASSYIKQLMSGSITPGERSAVYQAGAERGTLGGMPGGSTQSGNIFANNDLRTLGLMAGERQQQGLNSFMNLLQTVSGTVVPTAGQQIQSNQFQQDLGFRQNEANRNFGLNQDRADLAAAQFNQQYGPKLYERSYEPYRNYNLSPGGSGAEWRFYQDSMGRRSNSPTSLMFKYRNR